MKRFACKREHSGQVACWIDTASSTSLVIPSATQSQMIIPGSGSRRIEDRTAPQDCIECCGTQVILPECRTVSSFPTLRQWGFQRAKTHCLTAPEKPRETIIIRCDEICFGRDECTVACAFLGDENEFQKQRTGRTLAANEDVEKSLIQLCLRSTRDNAQALSESASCSSDAFWPRSEKHHGARIGRDQIKRARHNMPCMRIQVRIHRSFHLPRQAEAHSSQERVVTFGTTCSNTCNRHV